MASVMAVAAVVKLISLTLLLNGIGGGGGMHRGGSSGGGLAAVVVADASTGDVTVVKSAADDEQWPVDVKFSAHATASVEMLALLPFSRWREIPNAASSLRSPVHHCDVLHSCSSSLPLHRRP